MNIEKFDNGIFRLKIPFQDITTSVYFYVCEQGVAIVDSAKYSTDVDDYIIPALEELNIKNNVQYLLFTHEHGDHSGGLQRLSEYFPKAIIGCAFEVGLADKMTLTDNKEIIGNLLAIHLPGHTESSFGFYDTVTKTLLTGDCLQLDGVGKYRDGISDFKSYANSINKLKNMEICNIIAAHEYEPLGSLARGETEVKQYLERCLKVSK